MKAAFKAAIGLTALMSIAPAFGADETMTLAIQRPDCRIDRRPIIDRNGVLLAVTNCVVSLYANPQRISDPRSAAAQLRDLIPGASEETLRARLSSARRFVWVARHVSPEVAARVVNRHIAGIGFRGEAQREYPFRNATAHVIGFTGADEHAGLAGAERFFDATLRTPGAPLQLAIDVRVQSLLRAQLVHALSIYEARGAAGLVLDVQSSEVLGLISLPDFDPNERGRLDLAAVGNKAISSAYEPGGVFEIFATAMALEEGRVTAASPIAVGAPVHLASYTVRDDEPTRGPLSVADVFARSSMIGGVQIARLSTVAEQRGFMQHLGLLDKMPIELGETSVSPLSPHYWGPLTQATLSYGYGIALTPLQVGITACAIINGGRLIPPTLLKRGPADLPHGIRVVSEATSADMRALMRHAVERGTGQPADVPGYSVGGKTGTSLKAVAGVYDPHRRVTWFFAGFPMNDAPRYATLIVLDEPQGIAATDGRATAQWNAVPASANLIARLAPVLGVAAHP